MGSPDLTGFIHLQEGEFLISAVKFLEDGTSDGPSTRDPVNWEKATVFTVFPGATHILDFGPGGDSGLGALTSRNKEGTGVRVILAGTVDGAMSDIGYKAELFDRDEENAVKYAID
ncbi:Fatty acid synthase subunit beta [Fusarium oxysporum f. sp. rapae]|uniref:Fatty acid synthase subunit beta n=1 Tax=Fusarium oxysporum f. sp. rapae TaxID=485398 RepID=A0A8J5NE87_FUSOX|nr:Fatty acid synthase subunit beta [Fusarium oxysporum f. sp. rapae]